MMEISQFINGIDPWWLIFGALVLISFEWILFEGEIFLILGLSAIKIALVAFLIPNFSYSAWLVPLFLSSSFFFQRKIFRPLIFSKHPDENLNVIGLLGTINKSSDENKSHDVFFDYGVSQQSKNDVSIETASITLKDGRQFTVGNPSNLTHESTAKITKNNNGIVTVKEI
tara:strand:+ start:314 stop:826 length:513 start_codon:yes stop_codon:yes gene_type:complete